MNLHLKNQGIRNKAYQFHSAQDFIAAGVTCYAFSLLDDLGLIDQLISNEGLSPDCFRSHPNPLVIRTAVHTLECNNVILFDNHVFRLTELGKDLAEHRSSIGLIYNGYRKILGNQTEIAKDQPHLNQDLRQLIDENAISKAASQMGRVFFNKRIIEILENYSIKGRICDLGCGSGSTLISLCREKKLPGLGFDFSESSIEEAKKNLLPQEDITLLYKDICNVHETYQDVEILIQSFVMHDFPDSTCKRIFNSLKKHFPKAKLLLYIDAVSPENGSNSQLPGFDYIHSLFGIKPRSAKETSKLFLESGFQILNQEPIPGLTNSYIWTLSLSN